MPRYILLSDFQYGTHALPAGSPLADEVGDPIAALISAGAPLVPYSAELEALGINLRAQPEILTAVLLGARSGRALPVSPVDGACHLYVSPLGNDAHDGSVGRPFATVQKGFNRIDDWILTRDARDVVLHLGQLTPGVVHTYPEDVVWNPPMQPLRRVVVKTDRLQMRQLAAGTLTGGSSSSAIDAGAVFTPNQRAGKLLRLRTAGGVETHNATIRSHDATVLRPCQSFTAIPGAGRTYQILEPAVVIRSFQSSMPWSSLEGGNVFVVSKAPALIFMWVGFGPPVAPVIDALSFKGGEVSFIGCEVDAGGGFNTGVRSEGTSIACGEVWGRGAADPILENAVADDFDFTYLAGLHVRNAFNAIQTRDIGVVQGFPVVNGGFIFGVGQVAFFLRGGALHGAGTGIEIQGNSYMQLDGGFESALAFLVRANTGSIAVRTKLDCYLEIGNAGLGGMELNTILADAFVCEQQSRMRLRSVVLSGGGVGGRGVVSMHGSNVRVDAAVSFATVGANLQADDTVATFAALTPAAPVVGTAVLSGARIWEG
jgi:hypothetical protein